ncbi:MAG: hypothetical protein JW874_15920 [Spirochaetales bacterium]|nr:hypothetical protein [Spirochaetales bacterium]
MLDFYGFTQSELTGRFIRRYGKGEYHARALFSHVYRHRPGKGLEQLAGCGQLCTGTAEQKQSCSGR